MGSTASTGHACVAPARVLPHHPQHQVHDRRCRRRPAGPPSPREIVVDRDRRQGTIRRMTLTFRVAALLSWWVLALGCVSAEVTPIGPSRPAREAGCPVQLFPSSRPTYEYVDIASVRAECHNGSSRTACIDELRAQACAAGGDTVYAFSEGYRAEYTLISATIAYRNDSTATGIAASGRAPVAEAHSCTPICSPGFACTSGVCIPQCNPACEAGEVCTRRRICAPVPVAAPVPAPSATPAQP